MLETVQILEILGRLIKTWERREEGYKKPSSGWPADAVRGCRQDIEKLVSDIVSGSE